MSDEHAKKDVDPEEFVSYLNTLADSQGGCACVTVNDGHFIMLSRSMLLRTLNDPSNKDSERFVIFIHRPKGMEIGVA